MTKHSSDDLSLVCINEYPVAADAYIDKTVLNDHGIPCEVVGVLSTLYSPIPYPAGGARLMVFSRDAGRAAKLLHLTDDR